jgi:8-oxo-dGTP pyrophosphatase MutT (NUDIX family)
MSKPKVGTSTKGEVMHFSVGALIERGGQYLLIDRVHPPYGFAGPAGHVDEGEEPAETLVREIFEESGLTVQNHELVFEEELGWNYCGQGAQTHYWYLYKCDAVGDVKHNTEETKSIGWYTIEQIKTLSLEPVWEYWFKKFGIL